MATIVLIEDETVLREVVAHVLKSGGHEVVSFPDAKPALEAMDFGAADFKTDPDDGDLVFLELNTSPMFARFDAACGGALCRAMVEHLSS